MLILKVRVNLVGRMRVLTWLGFKFLFNKNTGENPGLPVRSPKPSMPSEKTEQQEGGNSVYG